MTSIPVGVATTMLQNEIFALPASRVRLFSSSAAPAFQQSNDPAFGNNVAVTLTDGMADLAGGFIRATAVGGAVVMLRKF
jgi:hypothetical protein